jgi:hypothetical protein
MDEVALVGVTVDAGHLVAFFWVKKSTPWSVLKWYFTQNSSSCRSASCVWPESCSRRQLFGMPRSPIR